MWMNLAHVKIPNLRSSREVLRINVSQSRVPSLIPSSRVTHGSSDEHPVSKLHDVSQTERHQYPIGIRALMLWPCDRKLTEPRQGSTQYEQRRVWVSKGAFLAGRRHRAAFILVRSHTRTTISAENGIAVRCGLVLRRRIHAPTILESHERRHIHLTPLC